MEEQDSNLIPKKLQKVLVSFVQRILRDRPTDYVNYCADYFRNLSEENKKQNQSKDGTIEFDDYNLAKSTRSVPLQGSVSLSALEDDDHKETCVREASSWNHPSVSKNLKKLKRTVIYNKADFSPQMGDQPDLLESANQIREDVLTFIDKDGDIFKKELESNEEESEELILDDKLVAITEDTLTSSQNDTCVDPSNEELDSYVEKLISLTSAIKSELSKKQRKQWKRQRNWAKRLTHAMVNYPKSSNSDDSDFIAYNLLTEEGAENQKSHSPMNLKDSDYKNGGQKDTIRRDASTDNLFDYYRVNLLIESFSTQTEVLLNELKAAKSSFCETLRKELGCYFQDKIAENEHNETTCNPAIHFLSRDKDVSKFATETSDYSPPGACNQENIAPRLMSIEKRFLERDRDLNEKNDNHDDHRERSEIVSMKANVHETKQQTVNRQLSNFNETVEDILNQGQGYHAEYKELSGKYVSNSCRTEEEASENVDQRVKRKRFSENYSFGNFGPLINEQRFAQPFDPARQTTVLPTRFVRPIRHTQQKHPSIAAVRPTLLSLIGEQGDMPPQMLWQRYSVRNTADSERYIATTSAQINRNHIGNNSMSSFSNQDIPMFNSPDSRNETAARLEGQEGNITKTLTNDTEETEEKDKLDYIPKTNHGQFDFNAENCELKLEYNDNNELLILITVENKNDLKINTHASEKREIREDDSLTGKDSEPINVKGKTGSYEILLNGCIFFNSQSDFFLENANLNIEAENDSLQTETNIEAPSNEAVPSNTTSVQNESTNVNNDKGLRQITFNLNSENGKTKVQPENDNRIEITLSPIDDSDLKVSGDFYEIPVGLKQGIILNDAKLSSLKNIIVDGKNVNDKYKEKNPVQGRVTFSSKSKLLFENINLHVRVHNQLLENDVVEQAKESLPNAVVHQQDEILNNVDETKKSSFESDSGPSEKENNSANTEYKIMDRNGELKSQKEDTGESPKMAEGDQFLKREIIAATIAKQNTEPGLTSAGGDFVEPSTPVGTNVASISRNGTFDNTTSLVDSSLSKERFSAADVENAVLKALKAQTDDADDFDYFFDTDTSDSSQFSDESSSAESTDC